MSDAPTTPVVFVLFGATGDLARRMVLPAFFALFERDLMPPAWQLVGNGRGDVSHDEFRAHVREVLDGAAGDDPVDEKAWSAFSSRLLFAGGGFTPDNPGSMLDVLKTARDTTADDALLVHFIATPPSSFEGFTAALGAHGLADGARVIYEKPFGTSPQGFRDLDDAVHKVFDEERVFRIDHFLGKEATQNLHVLRFANTLLGSVWHRDFIASVQIDVPETLDIDDRAEFYDATGATLDMLVTHLFQVAAEIAMEPPTSVQPADLQAAREDVIAAFRPLDPAEVVLGQFEGYHDVEGIDPDSQTDTFVAARLWIDTDRWQGVPFLLRTGKELAVSEQRVSIVFRVPDGPLTHIPPQGNVVTLSLSGGGEFDVEVVAKAPGPEIVLAPGTARLLLKDVGPVEPLPPYGALILDVIEGDRSLFTNTDGLARAWAAVEPLLDARPAVQSYPTGSWGPPAAAELAAPDGWVLGE